jgi:hypothetical protein
MTQTAALLVAQPEQLCRSPREFRVADFLPNVELAALLAATCGCGNVCSARFLSPKTGRAARSGHSGQLSRSSSNNSQIVSPLQGAVRPTSG